VSHHLGKESIIKDCRRHLIIQSLAWEFERWTTRQHTKHAAKTWHALETAGKLDQQSESNPQRNQNPTN